jgi:hypothetical protein
MEILGSDDVRVKIVFAAVPAGKDTRARRHTFLVGKAAHESRKHPTTWDAKERDEDMMRTRSGCALGNLAIGLIGPTEALVHLP